MISVKDLHGKTGTELDALFAGAPAGDLPTGLGRGTALILTNTFMSRFLAGWARLGAWKGKQFADDGSSLRNLISPFGIKAIKAAVYIGPSRIDDRPCVVLDYSQTSFVARPIRDEIREIAPGLYLGMVFFGKHKLPVRFALTFQ
ncbi:MAG: hypothetical protein K8R99_03130 [Actinomycetia bacterium]|nr:hypothetical protein [Actinomycetes bacterium]